MSDLFDAFSLAEEMSIVFQSVLWSVFGILICRERIVNANIPKILGRTLYWFGVPLQIFLIARKSDFEEIVWLPPIVTIMVLLLGLALALLILRTFEQLFCGTYTEITSLSQLQESLVKIESTNLTIKKINQSIPLPITNTGRGSFIIASILCNTGFIDVVLIPPLVDFKYWSWIVLYGVVHNIIGSYGLGVIIADHYTYSNNSNEKNNWQHQVQKLLLLPSLWAFAYGYMSKDLPWPDFMEAIASKGVLFVVPCAFILTGMQLATLQQWQNLYSGIFPTILKMLVIPGSLGLILTFFGLKGDSRLVLVLMSSMPTAFASVILTEEYNLDRQIVASSILLSTLFLPVIIIFWLIIF